MASTGFLSSAASEVRALFGIEHIESRPVDADKLWVDGAGLDCPRPMPLGGLLDPGQASVLIDAQAGDRRTPLLTRRPLADGAFAAVLNLRTRDTGEVMLMDQPVAWIDLPEPAANVVRQTALAGTGLGLRAPARTIVHPFSGHMLHLINARNAPSTVRLRLAEPWFRGPVRSLTVRALNQESKITPGPDGDFALTLPARARWALLSEDEGLRMIYLRWINSTRPFLVAPPLSSLVYLRSLSWPLPHRFNPHNAGLAEALLVSITLTKKMQLRGPLETPQCTILTELIQKIFVNEIQSIPPSDGPEYTRQSGRGRSLSSGTSVNLSEEHQ